MGVHTSPYTPTEVESAFGSGPSDTAGPARSHTAGLLVGPSGFDRWPPLLEQLQPEVHRIGDPGPAARRHERGKDERTRRRE
ncbi:MAG: hypothetical protein ACSLE8_03720 [Rhodococcus sp. (in: high G+C Gram-positive bacteria)]